MNAATKSREWRDGRTEKRATLAQFAVSDRVIDPRWERFEEMADQKFQP